MYVVDVAAGAVAAAGVGAHKLVPRSGQLERCGGEVERWEEGQGGSKGMERREMEGEGAGGKGWAGGGGEGAEEGREEGL